MSEPNVFCILEFLQKPCVEHESIEFIPICPAYVILTKLIQGGKI